MLIETPRGRDGLDERMNYLWGYLVERQKIWHRRTVLGQPWPWTLDPILQKWRFPNVYRSLDTGTLYLRERLIPALTPGQVLLNLVAYRHFNTIDAARRLLPLSGPLPENIDVYLDGENPYTQAYRTSPFTNLGGLTQIENARIASYQWAEFCPKYERHLEDHSMKDVMLWITNLPGVGRFVGYVITCDLIYTGLVDYTENHDVFPHTGSIEALSWLYQVPFAEYQAKTQIKHIQEQSTDALAQRGFLFLTDTRDRRIPLSLRNIEDGLCEFYRYLKLRSGASSGRRYVLSPIIPV